MESQIITEMKSLSDKMDRIQNEVSVLSKQFADHISTCQCRHSQTSNSNIFKSDRLTPIENSDYNSKEIESTTEHYSIPEKTVQRVNDTQKFHSSENSNASINMRQREKTSDHEVVSHLKYRRSFKESKRECLRKSLQQNIVLLVENLPYTETDILDKLIETECLTETECSDLRNNGSRKDCVRNLIRIIKGRSYEVLKTFVECVRALHPEVAASIWQVYEKLVKDKKNYSRQCTFCKLKRVDIKFVADHVWSTDAISDDLYDEIVSEKYCSEALWTKIADECNKASSSDRQNTLKKLSDALIRKGHYQDLVQKLSKVSILKCACVKINVNTEDRLTLNIVVTEVDDFSTVSPRSTSGSFLDENDNSMTSDDSFPVNEHENYFLSPRTADTDRALYDSCFGVRKNFTFSQSAVAVDIRTSRSNSFDKSSSQRGRLQALAKRRASMYT